MRESRYLDTICVLYLSIKKHIFKSARLRFSSLNYARNFRLISYTDTTRNAAWLVINTNDHNPSDDETCSYQSVVEKYSPAA